MIDYKNCNDVLKLPVLKRIVIDNILPEINEIKEEIDIGRKDAFEIPQNMWKEIKDPQVPSERAKKQFVKSYFSVCVYILKRVENLSISANQSYEKSVELFHSSSLRQTSSSTFRIENVIEGTATGDIGSLRECLTTSYEISKIEEYCNENTKRTTEAIRFEPFEKDRNVVFWDLSKIICIYRKDYKDKIGIVAYSDYFIESRKKTYILD